jgi:hypothetical protein
MTYEKVKNLKPEEFKRLCGVHPETFSQMTEVVRWREAPAEGERVQKQSLKQGDLGN